MTTLTTSRTRRTILPADGAAVPHRRTTGVLLLAGGLLMAVGGGLHPQGSGTTVRAHLLSMFADPGWSSSHVTSLLGAGTCTLALLLAWRTGALGPGVRRWLPLVAGAWAFGAVEQVPHLLAAHEAHALAHHEATPVLDVHVLLQVLATPAVGLTGALLAVVVARQAGTRPAWLLTVPAVVGGVLYALAAPLVALTSDPTYTVLFPAQAGLAVWLLGTGVRVLAGRCAGAGVRPGPDRHGRAWTPSRR